MTLKKGDIIFTIDGWADEFIHRFMIITGPDNPGQDYYMNGRFLHENATSSVNNTDKYEIVTSALLKLLFGDT